MIICIVSRHAQIPSHRSRAPRGPRRRLAPPAPSPPAARSRSSRPRTSGAASPPSSAATASRSTSVITNPATDPHDYEPTAVDARTIAGAQMVIVNGIGYDPWALEAGRRQSRARPRRARRRRPRRDQAGRQPASLVLAGERAAGDRRDRRRLHEARPEGRRRTSEQQKARVRDAAASRSTSS